MKALSKSHSEIIKGIAILLMIFHHLFRFPDRVPESFPIHFLVPGAPIEYQIGVFGKICITLFLFVTGYGLGTRCNKLTFKEWGRRIGSFYMIYVVNLVVLGGISWFFFRSSTSESGWWTGFDWSLKGLLGNLFLWSPSYSLEWGFAKIYVVILVVAWPLCEMLKRFGAYPLAGISLILYSISGYLSGFDNILSFQAAFVIGFILSHWPENDFHRFLCAMSERTWLTRLACVCVLTCIAFLLRKKTNEQTDWIVALFLVSAIALGAELSSYISRFLSLLGKYSAGMWLNHTFIFYYWFNEPFYSMRYSPLLLFVAVSVSLAMAMLMQPLISALQLLISAKPQVPIIKANG
jgi:hypothetical protein